jgi:hypothetical protein
MTTKVYLFIGPLNKDEREEVKPRLLYKDPNRYPAIYEDLYKEFYLRPELSEQELTTASLIAKYLQSL